MDPNGSAPEVIRQEGFPQRPGVGQNLEAMELPGSIAILALETTSSLIKGCQKKGLRGDLNHKGVVFVFWYWNGLEQQ